jgi:3-oxoacyl-[acyl-carrier protein] reductase
MKGARTVLVSGAGAGIGRAIAEAFAQGGDHVVVTDVNEAHAREVARGIVAQGRSAEHRYLDVARWIDVHALVDDVVEERGRIDVAVANAGVALRIPVRDLDEAAWDGLLDINLKGAAALLRAAARSMMVAGSGSLIAISSVSATTGWPEHAHYNASKAAVCGLVRGLAVELGPNGIRANSVLPGVIRTAQSLSEEHSLGAAGLEAVWPHIPLRRVGLPADVADVAVFLASDAARYITGQNIVVDGGLTIASY